MTSVRIVSGMVFVCAAAIGLSFAQCGSFGGSDSKAPTTSDDAATPVEAGDGAACTSGACSCTGIDVTKDDAANCGACGRACAIDPVLGVGECKAGVCTAVPVQAKLPYASVVVASGNHVYFADGSTSGAPGSVWHAAAPDFAPAQISVPQPQAVISMAVDDTNVYVVSAQPENGKGFVVRMPRTGDCDGGCASTLDSVTGGVAPLAVALSADAVFWVRSPSGNDVGELMTRPKAEGTPPVAIDQRSGYNRAGRRFPSLVTSNGFVYAEHEVAAGEPQTTNGVDALPIGGCPLSNPMCVVDRVTISTAGIAAYKDALFYVGLADDGGATHVGRVRDTEKSGTLLFADRPNLGYLLAVDDRDLYWVERDPTAKGADWTIARRGKDGTCGTYAPCPQIVARESCLAADPQCAITSIAIGDTMIFYARGGSSGGVYRTPK